MKKKTVALLLALALVFGGAVGGTIAWLTDVTSEVKNTFTVGDINIDLKESDNLDLKMVPGKTITKDPKVTVKANSEACWLFVKITKSDNFDSFMTYEMADGWTSLTGEDGVYYREVSASTADQEFAVIKDNQVKVKTEVTKTAMNVLTEATYPTLTFKAYACQKDGVETAAGAWAKVKD